MTTPRRVGTRTSKTRAVLWDCTQQLMLSEGYAAVTYRNVASRAGVTSGLVQYYFPTLDDLFIALVRDGTERGLKGLVKDLRTGQPLRAVWKYANNKAGAALTAELMALANHRKEIRSEIARAGEQARELALAALSATATLGCGPCEKTAPSGCDRRLSRQS